MVHVRIHPPLPAMLAVGTAVNSTIIDVDVAANVDLQTLFRQLAQQFPAFKVFCEPPSGDQMLSVMIAVDGNLVSGPDDPETVLRDGAEVALFPPYAGG